jgi:PREDICTED: similar to AGAP009239-PA
VKALVSSVLYQLYLHRSMVAAESRTEKSFHCKTVDCLGWCEYDDNVNWFCCPVCGRQNCLTCQAIHENMNCKQFQDQLNSEAEQNEDAKRTKQLLEVLNGV